MKTQGTYTIKDGLITGPGEGQCAGYIFKFGEHGAYSPTGKIKVEDRELTQIEIETHNKILETAEIDAAVQAGRGLFYFAKEQGVYTVTTWCEGFISPWVFVRQFYAPAFGGRITAYHVWFTGPDGKKWYGINKGDSQIVRARRMKGQ